MFKIAIVNKPHFARTLLFGWCLIMAMCSGCSTLSESQVEPHSESSLYTSSILNTPFSKKADDGMTGNINNTSTIDITEVKNRAVDTTLLDVALPVSVAAPSETDVSRNSPTTKDNLPAKLDTLTGWGKRLMERGQLNDAEKMFRRALGLDPGHLSAKFGLGMIYLRKENYNLAEVTLLRVLEERPDSVKLLNALGVLNDLQGKYDVSSKHYEAALAISAKSVKTLTNKGYSEYLQRNYEKASNLFDQAAVLDPSNQRIVLNRALVYISEGQHDEAAAVLRKLRPEYIAKNNLGYLYLVKGDEVRAKQNLQAALDSSTHFYPKAWGNFTLLDHSASDWLAEDRDREASR